MAKECCEKRPAKRIGGVVDGQRGGGGGCGRSGVELRARWPAEIL
jgi:hypothetical protein